MRLAAALLLTACGAPLDFSGKYEGILDVVGSCTAGGYDTGTVAWLVVDDGAGFVSVATPGQCKSIKATARGAVADVNRAVCPAWPSGDVTTLEKGTLTLDGRKLKVRIDTVTRFAATMNDCTATFTGTLIR